MVHHVQESGVIESVSGQNREMNKGSRSSVAEMRRGSNKFSSLANSVCHATVCDSGQRENDAGGVKTYAARVVALPISRYICLSIIAKDSTSPLVYSFWPNAVVSTRSRRK